MLDVITAIKQSRRPLVCGHVNPDADCIGSQLVMLSALKAMGKDAKVLLPLETVSRKYAFLLELMPEVRQSEPDVRGVDLIVVVDTALRKRINMPEGASLPDVPVCNIDHHLGNEKFGDVNWVESAAGSCSQLVFLLVRKLGVELDWAQATLLYSGVHADTRGFSLANTDRSALAIGAELAASGAKIGWVCQGLHRSQHISEFKLMRVVYANTKLSDCGRFAWSTVSQDEFAAIGAKPNDIDEQVGVPRSIEGVKIAVLFSETKPGVVRINFRAEDDVNILPLAKYFGGGGHAQASGATQCGSIDEVARRVMKVAVASLDHPDCLTAGNMEKINAE
jgi:phosphoesterase RecJ-like protein